MINPYGVRNLIDALLQAGIPRQQNHTCLRGRTSAGDGVLDCQQVRECVMIIELKAHMGDDGKITFEAPVNLPPGDVDIVITYLTDEEKQDEALWDAQFAATSPAAFDRLIEQGLEDYRNGQTDTFDPTTEDD